MPFHSTLEQGGFTANIIVTKYCNIFWIKTETIILLTNQGMPNGIENSRLCIIYIVISF